MRMIKRETWLLSKVLFRLFRQRKKRKHPWDYDKELYKRRNEIERFFLRIKRFRRVFTRYDKLDKLYLGNFMMAMIFDAVLM